MISNMEILQILLMLAVILFISCLFLYVYQQKNDVKFKDTSDDFSPVCCRNVELIPEFDDFTEPPLFIKNDVKFKDISDDFSPVYSDVKWIPEFDDFTEQPLFRNDDHFKCLIYLRDGSKNAYAPKSLSPNNDLTVCYYDKTIDDVKVEILRPGVLQAMVPLKNVKIGPKGEASFTLIFEDKKMPPLDLKFKDNVVKKFDSNLKKIKKNNQYGFQCENVTQSDIIGEDGCHCDNIARVCSIEKRDVEVRKMPTDSNVRLVLSACCSIEKVEKCRKILLRLLKAIHYRKKASEADTERDKWKKYAMSQHEYLNTESNAATKDKHGQQATFCKSIKTKYSDLMQSYNDLASEEIFTFFNEERGLNHIDLHGLLVVNEDALAEYKEQLLKHNPKEEVEEIINKQQERGDEAIRKLRERIDEFMEKMEKAQREKKTWLEVIVGAGHHSIERQKIQPKVKKYLQKKYPDKWSIVNEGSLVVTFEEYPNNGRCFGHYYCQTCKKSWKSGKSFKNKWQGCNNCFKNRKGIKNIFPVMQSPLSTNYHKDVGAATMPTQEHRKELCQVCTEQGSCS